MELLSFEDLVRSTIPLSKRPNGQGWWGVLCKVCGDHGRKGKRAGFKFDSDSTAYNCFNCGHHASYHHSSRHFSKEMETVLDAFNIPIPERQRVLYTAFVSNPDNGAPTQRIDLNPPTISLPPYITPLELNSDNVVDAYAQEYLEQERGIPAAASKFFIGRESKDPQSKKWFTRLILPVYKDGKLIFYTGRDLSGLSNKKYMSPDVSRTNVIFGYEHLQKDTTDPLYIVEGWFDAFHVDGVAVFGNRMTTNQLILLNRSRRPKVVIPDRYGDGYLLGEQALSNGWSVSTPDIGDCKDVNDAVMKYGKIYTMMSIKRNTFSGFEGEIQLNTYCKK